MTETLFRFQNIRAPKPAFEVAKKMSFRVETQQWAEGDPFVEGIIAANAAGKSREQIKEIALKYAEAVREEGTDGGRASPTSDLVSWAKKLATTPLVEIDFVQDLEEPCGESLDTFLQRDDVKAEAKKMSASILASALLTTPDLASGAAIRLKLLKLVEQVTEGNIQQGEKLSLGAYLARMFIVLPKAVKPEPRPAAPIEPPAPVKDPSLTHRRYLADLHTAHGALVAALREFGTSAEQPSDAADNLAELKLEPEFFARLPNTVRSSLEDAAPNPEERNPFAVVSTLEVKIAEVSGRLAAAKMPAVLLRVGDTWVDPSELAGAFGSRAFMGVSGELPNGGFLMPEEDVRCQPSAYVDDLLVVKQELIGYELADFAHVENIMAGETRSREHRRLNLSEETTTTETETETETERDLQSTDRNEIQSEVETKIKEDAKLEAGLQVSGSYGPAVSFQAEAKGSFASSSEETTNKAIRYSRETTEKASERISERVRKERVRRMLQEIEETNQHGFAGAQNKHTRGIYRWLNKKYKAQIYEYGQRMMLEFILPEPAAFYLHALVENPPNELAPPKPPTFENQPLKPENLDRSNYQEYVAAYRVRDIPKPPSTFVMKSVFEKQDGAEAGDFGRATKVTIPERYEAIGAQVSVSAARKYQVMHVMSDQESVPYGADPWDWDERIILMVGDQKYTMENLSKGHPMVFGWPGKSFPWRGEISVGFHAIMANSFSVNVDIICVLSDVGLRKWQHDAYDSIMQTYQSLKSDYDEAQAVETFDSAAAYGRNPADNRIIEKEEIKKLVIMSLMNDPTLNLVDPFRADKEPVFDPLLACAKQHPIRFFEHSFEWNNMLYVFYPYFWGRRKRWRTLLNIQDKDSDFAAFLKAGSVRVQLPVRPDFNEIVSNYLSTGDYYPDKDAPIYEDDTYLPIIDEITEKLGKPGEEKPYGEDPEPWEVTVPTSLVVVQDLEEIEGIMDCLTGKPMKLISDGG